MDSFTILFLVSSTDKFVPCFSQILLGVSQASSCSFPWDLFGPCMEGTDKCRVCFWQRKIFLTVADLRTMVMSDLWPLSSSFIWTLLIVEGFFSFSSSFTLPPHLTLQSLCAILGGLLAGHQKSAVSHQTDKTPFQNPKQYLTDIFISRVQTTGTRHHLHQRIFQAQVLWC